MAEHEHNPVEFYSDAQDDPLFVKCADCGELLDVSRDTLESLYNKPNKERPVASELVDDLTNNN